MAVYTRLDKKGICSLLSRYHLGELVTFQGIAGGVENTNYFLDIATPLHTQRYVLTIFEYLPESSLPFFIDYTDELNSAGLPVPAAIRDKQEKAVQRIKGKPAVIVPCLPGEHLKKLNGNHCQQVGELLGKIHQAGLQSRLKQSNIRGIDWLDTQQKRLSNLLPKEEVHYMQEQWQGIKNELPSTSELPKGLIHGDLFHDNALFTGDKLTGVIDFYQSCHDYLLYDLAVTVNDWCINSDLELDHLKTSALLKAYASVRPFTPTEQDAWPLMLRLAAFRFWISRIITFVHPEQAIDSAHQQMLERCFLDPRKFKAMLELRNIRDRSLSSFLGG